MSTTSENILRYVLDPSVNEYKDCRSVIFANLEPGVFRDEGWVLYNLAYKFKDMKLDNQFIEIYLNRHLGELVSANHKHLDLSSYVELAKDQDPSLVVGGVSDQALIYIQGVLQWYEELLKTPAPKPDISEVMLEVEKFKQEYCVDRATSILQKGLSILTTSLQERGKVLSGFEDACDYIRRELGTVDNVMSNQNGLGYLSFADMLENKEDTKPVKKVGSFAGISELNQHFGGLYTQKLITVAAPNKGGKTKFCMNLVYDAVVNYGQNVTLWAVEGSIQEMVAELQAIHFDRVMNSGVNPEECKTGVTKDSILRDSWCVKSWKEDMRVLSQELASNPEYGRIDFIDKPLFLETFVDDLNVSVESNGSSIVVVDYLSLAGSLNPRLSNHEIIREIYQKASAYCKRANICLISPAQYTQDTIRTLSKGGDGGSNDMRASVGGSAEILRSSDISFALWASTQDLLDNRMKFLSLPSRVGKAFEPFEIMTDLGVCLFLSKRG